MYAYVSVEVAMHSLLDGFEKAAYKALAEYSTPGRLFSERQCERLESLAREIREAIKESKNAASKG